MKKSVKGVSGVKYKVLITNYNGNKILYLDDVNNILYDVNIKDLQMILLQGIVKKLDLPKYSFFILDLKGDSNSYENMEKINDGVYKQRDIYIINIPQIIRNSKKEEEQTKQQNKNQNP
jgi:hypothetical protein